MLDTTLLALRFCAGLGAVLLLMGGGMLFLYWKDSWLLRLTGFVLALAGLVLAVVFARKLYLYQQSVAFLQSLQSVQKRLNFSGAMLAVGGYGTITKAKAFRTYKILRVLCGAVAVVGLALSVYYSVLMVRLYF